MQEEKRTQNSDNKCLTGTFFDFWGARICKLANLQSHVRMSTILYANFSWFKI